MQAERFYVYVHINPKDNVIFYVGKGKGKRAWSFYSRNNYWNRIFNKYGVKVEICQDGMNEQDAFLLEQWIIAKLKREGVALANMTEGGEGPAGLKYTVESRIKSSRSMGGRPINSSCGMSFELCGLAVDWLRGNGYPKANHPAIFECANKIRPSAYGRSWWWEGDEPIAYSPMKKSIYSVISSKVFCSNGLIFDSCNSAADWIRHERQITCYASNILKCASGEHGSAYGYSWWFEQGESRDYVPKEVRFAKSKSKPMICSNGMRFDSVKDAVKWLVSVGHEKANGGNLAYAANGRYKHAYGYEWKYL